MIEQKHPASPQNTQIEGMEESSSVRFEDLGLTNEILEGVRAAGFTQPSPIQREAIPSAIKGLDLIGQAQTGTGKTAAFGLPSMSRLKFDKTVEILVLTPTRELAIQVSDELFKLGKFAGVKTVPVVGGQGYLRQVELINRGAQIVVATPGRLMDHMREGHLKRFTPHIVILDEADEMLNRGFIDDMRQILSTLPSERQTLLFSATMPVEIKRLAQEFMKDPVYVQLNKTQQTNLDIEQRLIVVRGPEKEAALMRILEVEDPEKSIVFCRTKRDVDELQETLTARGFATKAIHGDMSQAIRNQAVHSLKEGRTKIIIATDVAARGIDIPNVTHVVNFSVPENRERYVHRIGRTGRAGRAGVAITLATPGDLRDGDIFTSKHAAEFTVATVPSREEVRGKMAKNLKAQAQGLKNDLSWNFLAESFASEFSAEELAKKLVALLTQGRSIRGGDESVGYSKEEAQKFLSGRGGRPQERSMGAPRRSGGSSFGRGGRSGGGRSGGGGGFNRFKGERSGSSSRPRFGGERSESSRSSFGGERSSRPAPRPSFGGERSAAAAKPPFEKKPWGNRRSSESQHRTDF